MTNHLVHNARKRVPSQVPLNTMLATRDLAACLVSWQASIALPGALVQ